jgi:DinB superfamily
MTETPQQYISRILGQLHDEDPLTVLESSPEKLAALVAGKSEGELRRQPAPGKWSIAEIAIHLAETEIAFAFRIRMILGTNGTPIQAFDQNAWAVRYPDMPIQPALDLFRVLRSANLALFRSLTPAEWDQFGMHAERGNETLRHISRLAAGHDLNHLAQVRALSADRSE